MLLKERLNNSSSDLSQSILVESMGVLYQNIEMSPVTKAFLLQEGMVEAEIDAFTPRYWEDYPENCQSAAIFITMTGEQANLVNYSYPGKAIMLSYAAEQQFCP